MPLEAKRTYLCVVDTIEPIVSSKKGTPGLKLRLVVSAGPEKGTALTDRIYYTGTKKSDWKKSEFLQACNEKNLGKTDAISMMEKFTGKKVLVRTAWEEGRTAEDGTVYDGQIRIGGFQVSAPTSAVSDSPVENTETPF